VSRRVRAAVRLVLLAQTRARFPHFYLAVTLGVVAALRFAVPDAWLAVVLPVFLLAEPGLLGLNLAAAHRYLEQGERSTSALLVSPLRPAEYVLALVLGSAVLGTAAGLLGWLLIVGPDARALWLAPPLALQSLLAAVVGVGLSLRYPDFTSFVLRAIPWAALLQAPLFAHFGLVDWAVVAPVPSTPALLAFRELVAAPASGLRLVALVAAQGAWCVLGLALLVRRFEGHLARGALA
jgi:fluoroquinolone transport system permease protein